MASTVKLLKRQTLTPSIDEDWENNRRYGVIIDAGSSGSRVYVYSWKDHDYLKNTYAVEELQKSIPIVERADKNGLKWTHRQEPGISTFGSKPHEVGQHLKGLLDFAQEVVPIQQQSSTPVFLMATAGVRLLPMDEQSALMDSTCTYIKENTDFSINDCEKHIQTIPGELEGVYGWVAINYLMGGFDAGNQSLQASLDQKQQHTFGFLDMGGASAQIAFEPDHHQKEEHVADLSKIRLRTLDGSAMNYDVFVTTFLGYGSNEARRRYLEQRVKMLVDEQQHQKGGDDAKGATHGTQRLLDEHHRLPLDDPCLPLHLELTDTDTTSVPLQLTGTGQFDKCLELTLPLLNKDAECPTKPCLFNGVHTPTIDWSVHQFVGISEYWYTSHDVLGLGGVYDFTEYEQKATAFCGKDWALELQEHPDWDATEIQRYQLQCFKSAWMVNVLHGGIEVPRHMDGTPSNSSGVHVDGSTNNTATAAKWLEQSIESVQHKNWNPPFRSIDTINDIQVSWTLGAMLLHVANQILPVDHGAGGFQGHNSDDEQPHSIVDGVELPSADAIHHHHQEITPGKDTWHSIPDETSDIGAASWDLSLLVSVIGLLMMLIVLFGVVFMEWYRHSKKRRRSLGGLGLGDYRRVDINGGILGNIATVTTPSLSTTSSSMSSSLSSLLAGPIMVLQQITARPLIVLRYWTSHILSHRGSGGGGSSINSNGIPDANIYPGHAPRHTELDPMGMNDRYDQSSVSIAMYQQQIHQQQHTQLQQQQQQQQQEQQNYFYSQFTQSPQLPSPQLQQQPTTASPNGTLGPCTKPTSIISMKYWHKKRYSGDSQRIAQIMHPSGTGSSTADHGGATSAIGYANRSNSMSSLMSRTGSPMLSGDGMQMVSSSPSASMTRSRSRVGFTVNETSEEDDYLAAGDHYGGNEPGSNSVGLPSNDLVRFAATTVSRTPSPSQTAALYMTNRTAMTTPSPKDSPRSSLDKV